jgi:hypothetical protein
LSNTSLFSLLSEIRLSCSGNCLLLYLALAPSLSLMLLPCIHQLNCLSLSMDMLCTYFFHFFSVHTQMALYQQDSKANLYPTIRTYQLDQKIRWTDGKTKKEAKYVSQDNHKIDTGAESTSPPWFFS